MRKPRIQPWLYIYVHIPKCAGSTFTYHLEQNYPKDILMPLYNNKFYNHATGRFEHPGGLAGAHAHVCSLSQQTKSTIRFAYGHLAYCRTHTCFSQPVRYITFLRNPVFRVVSTYYQYRRRYRLNLPLGSWAKLPPDLPFDVWLESGEPRISNYMTRVLSRHNEDASHDSVPMNSAHLARAKKNLEHFFYVGITEKTNIDFSYLFDVLRLKKFFKARNITTDRHVAITDALAEKISSKNRFDSELYNHALKINRAQRTSLGNFWPAIARTWIRRTALLFNKPAHIDFMN